MRCVAWAPSGATFLTASFDSETYAWEQEQAPESDDDNDGDVRMEMGDTNGMPRGEWECAATLEGHESEVKCVAYSASGTLVATCGRDKTVYVWEGASHYPS